MIKQNEIKFGDVNTQCFESDVTKEELARFVHKFEIFQGELYNVILNTTQLH